MITGPILPDEVFRHRETGHRYRVLCITNKKSVHPVRFPVTVVYVALTDIDRENPYSRTLATFVTKFERIK